MGICLERGADLHMAQLMPLPLAVSCFSKIQIGFTFLVLGHLGSPGQSAIKRVCVCVCVCVTAGVTEVWVMIGICGYARISARYEGQMSGVGANVLHSASTTGLHVAKCAESVE